MAKIINQNVVVNGHRTSIRLTKQEWELLDFAAAKVGLDRNQFVSAVKNQKPPADPLTSSVRAAAEEIVLNVVRAARTTRPIQDAHSNFGMHVSGAAYTAG